MEEKPTINQIVEDVKKDICDHYCKWPEEWDAEANPNVEFVDAVCAYCPLNRL